jgi:hypothetical protein
MDRVVERVCVWCGRPIAPDVQPVLMAGEPLHPACAPALEAELWGAPLDETDIAVWEPSARVERSSPSERPADPPRQVTTSAGRGAWMAPDQWRRAEGEVA